MGQLHKLKYTIFGEALRRLPRQMPRNFFAETNEVIKSIRDNLRSMGRGQYVRTKNNGVVSAPTGSVELLIFIADSRVNKAYLKQRHRLMMWLKESRIRLAWPYYAVLQQQERDILGKDLIPEFQHANDLKMNQL